MFYLKLLGPVHRSFGPFDTRKGAETAREAVFAGGFLGAATILEDIKVGDKIFTHIEIEFLREVRQANCDKVSGVRIIKYIREVASCGLKEAKDFFDQYIANK